MVTEETIQLIKEIGIIPATFFAMYLLSKIVLQRMWAQADRFMTLMETVVKENTKALQQMQESLIQHMRQKEPIIENMKDCRRERDEKLEKLLNIRSVRK